MKTAYLMLRHLLMLILWIWAVSLLEVKTRQLMIQLVQIPVTYRARVGESSVTGDRLKAVRLGLEMIAMLGRARLRWSGSRPGSRGQG